MIFKIGENPQLFWAWISLTFEYAKLKVQEKRKTDNATSEAAH